MFSPQATALLPVALLSAFLFSSGAPVAQAEEGDKEWLVEFRLTNWKTLHFHDEKKATAHYNAVKQLGCEAKKFAHGDHLDVRFRCTKWRTLKLKTDAEAHKWEKWLKAVGFETKHEH